MEELKLLRSKEADNSTEILQNLTHTTRNRKSDEVPKGRRALREATEEGGVFASGTAFLGLENRTSPVM